MMTIVAMHMSNRLLSLPVAAATLALAGVAVALAARRTQRTLDADRMPLMGVMGAFVFAAQMINFTLPGMPGTSGHLGGGVLLAILLGPAAGILTMAGILIVQCLLFNDGGLLALGTNILNMGVVPCLAGWALYRALLGRPANARPARQYLAAWAACVAGVTLGAALVPVQAGISGVLQIPVPGFLAVMVGVHLLIGLFEGAITFAVLAYLRQTRPAVLGLDAPDRRQRLSRPAVLASLVITALLLAGVVSWFASGYEDGLEWSLAGPSYGRTGEALADMDPVVAAVDDLQGRTAPLPDYTARVEADVEDAPSAWPNVDGWASVAGLAGTLVTLGLLYGTARLLSRRRVLTAEA